MFSRKAPEPAVQEDTLIWNCTSEHCKGWMRNDFAFHTNPTCPLCSSDMIQESRLLPVLVNHNQRAAFS